MWSGVFFSLLVLVVLPLLPQGNVAYAHESWFVDQGRHLGEGHQLDWTNAIILLGGFLFIAAAVLVSSSPLSHRLDTLFDRFQRRAPKGIEWRIVAALAAVTLFANAFAGVFLAEGLVLPGNLAVLGAVAQALIGILLLSQLSFLIPGVLILLVALPLAIVSFPPGLLIDYAAEFAALGLALVFFGLGNGYLDRRICSSLNLDPSRYAHLPVPIIRIGVGLTFAILALNHKLLSPDLALTFLDEYPLNFMPLLGFSGFSNLHFVSAAGVIEVIVGLLLVFGIATRFVGAIVVLLLLTTMVVLGPTELVGHLPILGAVALLIYTDSGGYRLAPTRLQLAFQSVLSHRT